MSQSVETPTQRGLIPRSARTLLTPVLCLVIGLAQVPPLAAQATPVPVVSTRTVESSILGTPQVIWWAAPEQGSQAKLPVLFVLDAENNFLPTLGVAAALQRAELMPDVLFVGLPGANREYDYSPVDIGVEYMETGGGPEFLRFFEEELIPFVELDPRVATHRTVVGHSLTALFGLFALAERPGLFQNVVAISPSLWWGDATVSQSLIDAFSGRVPDRATALFLTMANEGTLDDPDGLLMLQEYERFVETVVSSPERSLRVGHLDLFHEDHLSTVTPATHAGLKFVYADWSQESMYAQPDLTLDMVREQMAEKSATYGFPIPPSYAGMVAMGSALHRDGDHEGAVRVYRYALGFHPEGLQLTGFLGRSLVALDRWDEAQAAFLRALEIAESTGSPMVPWVRERLAEVESARGATEPR